jgi:hypothetical protein
LVPVAWLVVITFTAGLQKIGSADPKLGFLSQAAALSAKAEKLEQSGSPEQRDAAATTRRLAFNQKLDAIVTALFLGLVGCIVAVSAARWIQLLRGRSPLDLRETPPVWLPDSTLAAERIDPMRGLVPSMLLGFSLLRHLSGEAKLERVESMQTVCRHCPAKEDRGALWAQIEDERFRSPRCC